MKIWNEPGTSFDGQVINVIIQNILRVCTEELVRFCEIILNGCYVNGGGQETVIVENVDGIA